MAIAVLSFDRGGDHAAMAASPLSMAVYVPEQQTVKDVRDHATKMPAS